MNERIYKSTSFQVVKELIILVCACAFLAFLLKFVVDLYVNILIVAAVAIISLYFTLSDKKLYLKVTDDTLTIVKGKKVDEYKIEECAFKATSKNNDILSLIVIDSSGNTKSYDVSLLGYRQFEKLIEDLRIVGDKSESIVLKAK